MYRIYTMLINLNGTFFSEIWIDPHYELKHKDSINDELILELILKVTFENLNFSKVGDDGFSYYESNLEYEAKLYRLILTVPADKHYVGVVNAYRRSK